MQNFVNHGGAAESYFACKLQMLPSVGARTELSSLPYYVCGGSIQRNLVWLQRWKTIMVIINVHLCYFSNQWKKNSLVGMNMYNCIIWIWLIMVLICSSDYNLPAAVRHFSITINVDCMFDDAMTHFSVLKKVSSGPSCKCWRRIVMCMYSVLPHMLPFAKKNLRLHLVIFPFF